MDKLKTIFKKYKKGLVPISFSSISQFKTGKNINSASASNSYTAASTSNPNITIGSSSGTLSKSALQRAFMTTSTGTFSTSDAWPDELSKEEEKVLANVGFEYDTESNTWNLRLSVNVCVTKDELLGMMIPGHYGKPTDRIITQLKKCKKAIIEKLTAKIILAELIRPREIKK